MITIVKETNGNDIDYIVVDMRDFKVFLKTKDFKEAEKEKNKQKRELYKGSGVFGNEI